MNGTISITPSYGVATWYSCVDVIRSQIDGEIQSIAIVFYEEFLGFFRPRE